MLRFELLEWHDRKYRHMQYVNATLDEVKRAVKRLNRGYTGPRFIYREVKA